jgi:hypothetical protein
MKNLLKILILIILIQLTTSCESKTEREKEIEKIKNESNQILIEIETNSTTEKITNEINLNVNIDSIQKEWLKIHSDSAELGLIYLKKTDSLYKTKISEIKENKELEIKNEKEEIKKNFEKLKQKFNFKKDEFQDIGFYTHKTWGKYYQNRKTLTSGVNSDGYAWLRSNYSSNDWLFHTSIYVLIDDKKLSSPTVETYNENNIQENDGGRIWEIVTYNNTDILKEIAGNLDKIIKVRFNGSQHYDDTTLSKSDKQALKDCYELSEMIKKLKE